MVDPRLFDLVPPLAALRPDLGANQRDLDDALSDVSKALSGGQVAASLLSAAHRSLLTPPTAGFPPSQWAEPGFEPMPFTGLVAPAAPFEVSRQRKATAPRIVRVRTSPVADADPLAPAWARGMQPTASRGPFLNELGERLWIDTFILPQLVTIVAQATPFSVPRMLCRVPLSPRIVPSPRRRLASGSVWLSANVLVPGRPANEFAGTRIAGGSLELDGITSATASTITLSGAWHLKLNLRLDAPANPAPGAGPGADASNASIALPATVTLRLDATGALTVDVGDSSATAYDSSVALARSQSQPFYDSLSSSIVVPCTAAPDEFAFSNVRSDVLQIGAASGIARSGWALVVTATTPQALGEAQGAGYLWLELSSSLRAQWTGLPKPSLLRHSVLGLAPGIILFWAEVIPADVTHRLRLWDESQSDPPRQSSIEVTSVAGSTVFYVSQPGSEAVIFAGKAIGHFDRPLVADAGRVGVRMPAAWFVLVELPSLTTGGVIAVDLGAFAAPHFAFALENSLLKVRPPAFLGLTGPLTGDQLKSGIVLLRFPFRALLPTLPDPYAANFEFDRRQDADVGWTTAVVIWLSPPTATLAFSVQAPQILLPLAPPTAAASVFASREIAITPPRILVDVSSNADQFGVAIPFQVPGVSVQGMALVAPARDVGVVTLPPISWEPMLTKAPVPGDGDLPLPPPPHDGGISGISADSADVRPIAPIPLLTTYHDAILARRHFSARLPLPFGLIAQLDTRRNSDAPQSSFLDFNSVYLNLPAFSTGVAGGLQLAIRGDPNPDAEKDPPQPFTDNTWPGFVELRNEVAENHYAQAVLSTDLFAAFDSGFGRGSANGIPLRHYELSGYGASLMSDWRDTAAPGPAIVEARFDVFVGRTSHEVIQMQSVLYPWFVRVVRTITMDRTFGGWVLREDSGWVAVSNGFFEYPKVFKADKTLAFAEAFDAAHLHPGAIVGAASVRNIRTVGALFDVPPTPTPATPVPTKWQAVLFDADIVFAVGDNPRLTVAGGSVSDRTPARDISGWIQIDGPKFADPLPSNPAFQHVAPASAAAINDLLLTTGPAMAPIACGLELGGVAANPGLAFRAVRTDVSIANDGAALHLVAAVRGSPALPRDGAWSLARRTKADSAPNALDPNFPVPLVRPNTSVPGSGLWHLADAGDITQLDDGANPVTRYGLVQSLGAQKVFFERPRVSNAADPITLPQPPKLADMGALLNAAGVFPGLTDAFDFQTLKALSVDKGDLGFTETFTIGAVGAIKTALLADLGAIQVRIEYRDEHEKDVGVPADPQPTKATVTVDPLAAIRWSLLLTRLCFTVVINKGPSTPDGEPLIRIFADVKADAQSAPTVANLNVRYEGILGALQTIFTNVQQVAKFLPGGSDSGLHVGFSQGRLTVRNAFALPNLPLGTGQITDIAVEMGFDVALSPFDVRFVAGLGSEQKPFRWVVSPLAGTGVVQVAISKQGLDVLVQGGLGVGLCIDLGIAAGSAAVALAIELNTEPHPFMIKGILSGRASVDVLQGLASATITLAAGLGIIPDEKIIHPPFLPPTIPPKDLPSLTIGLVASVAVGIHISICWVVDVDFDGYWQFRQDITTPPIHVPI